MQSGFRFFNIERFECESFQDYLERCYFITNNFKSGQYNFDDLVEKSKLYNSVKILKCKYSDDQMKKIKEMAEYSGVKI